MHPEPSAAPTTPDTTTFSNAVRLNGWQWLWVGLFTAMLFALPSLWKRIEPLVPEPDYRMPHDLSNDYWLYERVAGLASEQYDVVLLGDSVIWGEYVTPKGTLSHYLNELSGKERCANLGLDGAHPLALAGLIEHYCASIAGKKVVLHCNPLWLSSPKADLQDDKVTEFNHPRLVPQFNPWIPSYKEEISPRIGVVVEQHLELNSWANHLQQAYYDRRDIPSWTLEHPYDNPVGPLAHGLPPLDPGLRHLDQAWYKSGIRPQDYPWVDLESSLQWPAFQRAVRILRQRGNQVLVVVGPFNEHLLTGGSRQRYEAIKTAIAAWLGSQNIQFVVPPALESAEYGDASHPLKAGYRKLAEQLLQTEFFQSAGDR
jgi:hypothetical protein